MSTVTAIIPCGGSHARYVGDAVESCFQADPQPDHVIVIDDTSDPPVKLPDRENFTFYRLGNHRGRCYARNFAAGLATTDWLYFLDSDDLLEPTAIGDFRDILEKHNPDIVYADYDYVDMDGERVRVHKGAHDIKKAIYHNAVNIGLFVRRDRFALVGGFDEDMHIGEYWDFFLKYTANPNIKYHKHDRPFFVARPSSVLPNAQRLMELASMKIRAMIRGEYYKTWRRI